MTFLNIPRSVSTRLWEDKLQEVVAPETQLEDLEMQDFTGAPNI